jgi:hypothetical protein
LVKKKDKTPAEQQVVPAGQQSLPIAPASNPPKLRPALPETYVSPQQKQLQQMAVTSAAPTAVNIKQQQINASALQAAGFVPGGTTTQTIGQRTQQTVSDRIATENATKNQKSMGEGAYVKKNGKWIFIPKNQFQGGFNPGTMTDVGTGGFGIQEYVGGRFAGDIKNVVKTPFVYFKKYAGSPIAKVSSKTVDSIPYTEWAEDVVGKTLSVSASAGSSFWNTAVRDPIRSTMTLAMTPLQIVENLIFFGAASINYSMGDTESYNQDVSIWDQMKGVLTNTTLFQGAVAGGTGEGYLPSGPAEIGRASCRERVYASV